MSKVKVLITRPKMVGDEATSHTYYWADPLIREIKELGYECVDYKVDNVTYDNVSNAFQSVLPNVYIHFGHGCPSLLIGQYECILTNGIKHFDLNILNDLSNTINLDKFEENKYKLGESINCDSMCIHESNVKLLNNKIVIAYACHSAKRLGQCAMKYGAKSYAGFDDYLIFMADSKKTENLFTEPLLEFAYSLFNGDTLRVAREKTFEKYDELIRKYKNVKYLALLLLWDRESFKVYGDENLTIFS